MKRWFLLALTIVLVSGACGRGPEGDDPSLQTQGVRGSITYGPLCPVVQAGSPCPDRPWRGKVQAFSPDGTLVTEVDTDAAGSFTMPLHPGKYTITPLTPDGPPTAKSRSVTVSPRAFVEVVLQVDSGIR